MAGATEPTGTDTSTDEARSREVQAPFVMAVSTGHGTADDGRHPRQRPQPSLAAPVDDATGARPADDGAIPAALSGREAAPAALQQMHMAARHLSNVPAARMTGGVRLTFRHGPLTGLTIVVDCTDGHCLRLTASADRLARVGVSAAMLASRLRNVLPGWTIEVIDEVADRTHRPVSDVAGPRDVADDA